MKKGKPLKKPNVIAQRIQALRNSMAIRDSIEYTEFAQKQIAELEKQLPPISNTLNNALNFLLKRD